MTGDSSKSNQVEQAADDEVDSNQENLEIVDLVEGKGAVAENGNNISIHYVGLFDNGRKFDSSYDRENPLFFNLGSGDVITGLDKGIEGMKVGGKRKIMIPSHFAYGSRGISGIIPADTKLTFHVELLSIQVQ